MNSSLHLKNVHTALRKALALFPDCCTAYGGVFDDDGGELVVYSANRHYLIMDRWVHPGYYLTKKDGKWEECRYTDRNGIIHNLKPEDCGMTMNNKQYVSSEQLTAFENVRVTLQKTLALFPDCDTIDCSVSKDDKAGELVSYIDMIGREECRYTDRNGIIHKFKQKGTK